MCDIWHISKTTREDEIIASTTDGIIFVTIREAEEVENAYDIFTTKPLFPSYNCRGTLEILPDQFVITLFGID